MLLHFILLVKEKDIGRRKAEFGYVERMGAFYRDWIRESFGLDYDVKCDEMVTRPRSVLQRLDTAELVRDHESRGKDVYHFYLSHFHPLWTDCTCEGYHAENFGMAYWAEPGDPGDTLYMAEKNCTVVSHEIAHEALRAKKDKGYVRAVHDLWTKHLFGGLPFLQYGADHKRTGGRPEFLTLDPGGLSTS